LEKKREEELLQKLVIQVMVEQVDS